jgi:hypothetical protein
MMAETLVEKNVCGECGAEVRPQTAFCYNCGKPVRQIDEAGNKIGETSEAWFGETLVYDGPIAGANESEAEKIEETAVEEPDPAEVSVKETEAKTEVLEIDPLHHSIPADTGLKSAASIRRKPKTFSRDVEVVWEEYEKPPTAKFILVTLLLVLFTIVVFLLAMQMK